MSIRFLLLVAIAFVLWRTFTVVRRVMQRGRRNEGPDIFERTPPTKPKQTFPDAQDATFEDLTRTESKKTTPS
jgi:hypothetical protein